MSFFNPIKFYLQSLIRRICFFVKKYPAQHIIALIVISMHLLPFTFRHKSILPISKTSQKLQVFTYTTPRPTRIGTQTPTPINPKKKLNRSKVNTVGVKNISKDTLHSMQKIYNKLQQMEKNTTTQSSALLIPELPNEPKEEPETVALSYQTILLDYLEKNIFLPEQGTVDLQITLSDNGKPISIKIIHSTSKINADFLCTELEKHVFPPFFKQAKEKTFILSFQSHVT